MMKVAFDRNNGYEVGLNGEDLPENASRLLITFPTRAPGRQISPPRVGAPMATEALTLMLKRAPRKLSEITLAGIEEEVTPEYLSLLITILRRADRIVIEDIVGDAPYSCLMSGLLHNDGPRELYFSSLRNASLLQANILWEGIALSTSLEKLYLDYMGSADLLPIGLGTGLIQAIRRNSSLKRLGVPLIIFADHESGEFINSVLWETSVEHLYITKGGLNGDRRDVPLGLVADAFCRETCRLKSLSLMHVVLHKNTERDNAHRHGNSAKNSSVTDFSTCASPLDCSGVMDVVNTLFRNLVTLDISHHQRLSDLSALDPLLVGSNLTLKKLILQCNSISEEDAIVFFRKLPQMTCLEYVDLGGNPFNRDGSTMWMNIAIDSIKQNKSLECVSICHTFEEVNEKIRVPLSLNRGGRRALEARESPLVLATNLWPKVLERASRLSYCDYAAGEDDWYNRRESPVESTRVDVVFWLLREKIVGNCL